MLTIFWIQIGDILDRGDQEKDCLDVLLDLQKQVFMLSQATRDLMDQMGGPSWQTQGEESGTMRLRNVFRAFSAAARWSWGDSIGNWADKRSIRLSSRNLPSRCNFSLDKLEPIFPGADFILTGKYDIFNALFGIAEAGILDTRCGEWQERDLVAVQYGNDCTVPD